MRRNLRGGDDLQAWMTNIERRVNRVERRGQTVVSGAARSGGASAQIAVWDISDIPESTDPSVAVLILSSGVTMRYDEATRAWVEPSLRQRGSKRPHREG